MRQKKCLLSIVKLKWIEIKFTKIQDHYKGSLQFTKILIILLVLHMGEGEVVFFFSPRKTNLLFFNFRIFVSTFHVTGTFLQHRHFFDTDTSIFR